MRTLNMCPTGPEFDTLVKAVGKMEAMRDWMENDGQVRTPEQVIAKVSARTNPAIKVGVSEVFSSNPQLSEIGTEQQYSEYLNTVFPDSQVKKILYRVDEKNFESFDAGKQTTEKAFYFFDSYDAAKEWNEVGYYGNGNIRTFVINVNKLGETDLKFEPYNNALFKQELSNSRQQGNDGHVFYDVQDMGYVGNQYTVSNPKQIHALGSKQDIEAFKAFVGSDTVPYVKPEVMESAEDVMLDQILPLSASFENTEYTRANEIARKLMQGLSGQTGIDYEVVSPEEAAQITKGSVNEYRGEPAFFFNGSVYFVTGRLNTESVFHEFSHPIIRQLGKNNPKVFNKLYNDLLNTPEGAAIKSRVIATYPELEPESFDFIEEVLVTALGVKANQKFDEQPASTGFSKFIKDIFYAMKQMFRKLFGQTSNVSKLDENTTLDELADMLVKGGKFIINTESVSDKDQVAYMRDQINKVNDMAKVAPVHLREMASKGFEIARRQVNLIMKNRNYREMLNILADEFNRGDLQEIKSNLGKYSKYLENKMDDLIDDINYNQNQAEALVNTLFRLQNVFSKIEEHMKKLDADPDKNSKDNMQKAFYYNNLVNYWKGFLENTINILDSTPGIPKENELYQLVAGLDRSAQSIRKTVNGFYSEGVRDTLYENLLPMAINMRERFESIMNTLTKAGANQASRDRQYKEYYGMTELEHKRFMELQALEKEGRLGYDQRSEYQKLKLMSFKGTELTKEKLEETLKGNLGDVFWANGYLEGVLYSDDPVVGGFGLYVSNAMNEVMTKAQAKYNIFAEDIREDLKKAGYNPTNIGELGRRVGFVDKIGVYDADQNRVVEKKIWTFLNPWKDYRYEIDKLEDNIRQARRKYLDTDSDEDKAALMAAMEEKRKHDNAYMNQEYVPEYYEFRDKFMRDKVGKEAFFQRDTILEEIRSLQEKVTSDAEMFAIQDQVDAMWRKYRLLHSLYNVDGTPKQGDARNIALRLQEYSKQSRKFYKFVERPGYFDNALLKFKQSLLNRGLNPNDPDDLRAQAEVAQWFDKNMRVVLKQEFYEKRKEILDKIADVMAKYPERAEFNDQIQDAYSILFDNVAAFKDNDNQPNGTLMSEGRIANVKAAQEYISNLREEATTGSYMDEADYEELNGLFDELSALQTRVPTQYYMDMVNGFIRTVDSPLLEAEVGKSYLDQDNINLIYRPEILNELKTMSPEFKEWFEKNHIVKVKRNARGEYVDSYERIYVWNVVKPNDPSYYESYQLKDENGDVVETIPYLPANKFYARVVKDEYKTGYVAPTKPGEKGKVKLVVGTHIDNKGNWLPRADVKDSPYRNEDYYKLQSTDPNTFNLLEKLKKHHIEHQKGLSGDAKLYLDFPRFEKSTLEAMRTRNKLGDEDKPENFFQWMIRRMKEFFTGAKDMPESGFNNSDEFRLATLDLFDNETSKIPMQGLYDIDYEDVSTDITNGMLRYMLSAERNKKLVEIMPTARAIQSVLENNNLKNTNIVNRDAYVNRGEITYANSKEKYLRKHFVDALIEREFEGQTTTGYGKNSKVIHNLSSGIFQTASLGFFALNVPSALKNWFGAKYQGMIEAVGGKYFNMKDFAAAEGWSMKTMGEISLQVYKQGAKSKDVQIWELFNPMQNLEDKFRKEGLSRSLAKDVANMSWLMNFRKWTEIQASMQIFGAYMKRQQVETKDGKKMDYLDAWEVKEGKIQLKAEVKPEYGITYNENGEMVIGDKFRAKQQEIQAVIRNLQGAYDKFNQPEAQRFILFRFVSYLRRFFTTMLIDRFGFKIRKGVGMVARYQPGLGNATEGWYISIMKLLRDVMRTGPKRFAYMLPDERRAMLKFTGDVVALSLMYLAQAWLFDWDPDDEDRYDKLRAKSGAMRAPFVTDDDNAFHMGGWLSNHALNLLIQTHAEQYQFLPIPGLGLQQYKEMTDLSSIAFGPTLENYFKVVEDLWNLGWGDESAYYKKEVGPYQWQQEEGSKFINHMARSIGFTGTFWSPEQALQNYVSIQSRQ